MEYTELSLPQGLKTSLPDPESPWNINNDLFRTIQETDYNPALGYRKCVVTNVHPEHEFILRYFTHQKPSNYSIRNVYCVHNGNLSNLFSNGLQIMENEATKFPPYLSPVDPLIFGRYQLIRRWKTLTDEFFPLSVRTETRVKQLINTKILPLWHGSSSAKCESICSTGFTFFGKHHFFNVDAMPGNMPSTDPGYFGSGIYFTTSARYASMYSSGHLLLSWVSMRQPYPVLSDVPHPQRCTDMKMLEGAGAYQTYNAHYIPVASISPQNPACMEYYPCYQEQPAAWDEIVVFNSSQTLPRFWVELEIDLPHPVGLHNNQYQVLREGLNLQAVCTNNGCAIAGQRFVANKGYGDFDIGQQFYNSTCPCCNRIGNADNFDTIFLKGCMYSYQGRKQDGTGLQKEKTALAGSIQVNISVVNYLRIIIEPL